MKRSELNKMTYEEIHKYINKLEKQLKIKPKEVTVFVEKPQPVVLESILKKIKIEDKGIGVYKEEKG